MKNLFMKQNNVFHNIQLKHSHYVKNRFSAHKQILNLHNRILYHQEYTFPVSTL